MLGSLSLTGLSTPAHTVRELRRGWSGERQRERERDGRSAQAFGKVGSVHGSGGGLFDKSGGNILALSPQGSDLCLLLLCCIHDFTYLDGVRAWIYLGLDTLLDTG